MVKRLGIAAVLCGLMIGQLNAIAGVFIGSGLSFALGVFVGAAIVINMIRRHT